MDVTTAMDSFFNVFKCANCDNTDIFLLTKIKAGAIVATRQKLVIAKCLAERFELCTTEQMRVATVASLNPGKLRDSLFYDLIDNSYVSGRILTGGQDIRE